MIGLAFTLGYGAITVTAAGAAGHAARRTYRDRGDAVQWALVALIASVAVIAGSTLIAQSWSAL